MQIRLIDVNSDAFLDYKCESRPVAGDSVLVGYTDQFPGGPRYTAEWVIRGTPGQWRLDYVGAPTLVLEAAKFISPEDDLPF